MNLLRIPILGVNISAINMDMALAQIQEWVTDKTQAYVCVAPAHAVMECVNNPGLLPVFNNANMITPDGMSIVWLLKLKGYKNVTRVYGPDLMLAACAQGLDENRKHFFFGGKPGIADKLANILQSRIPGLQVSGTYSPPFGKPSLDEEHKLLDAINQSGADILWVGRSSPWQEVWMHEHLGKINVPVMVGVGAAFDFLSGSKVQAPHWMQRSGMEWLFRLISEPKRLWPRYKEYPRFILLVLKEIIMNRVNRKEKNG